MPSTRITTKRSLTTQGKRDLIDATHESLLSALKIPEWDRLIIVDEVLEENFATPPGTSPNYTLVEISLFPGRSIDAKRKLYQEIVTRYEGLGILPTDIRIILKEVGLENWGIRGGIPASDIDLGFEVKV